MAVIWRFCSFGTDVGFEGLPELVAVVGALVHVYASDSYRGAVEVEIEAPEGGAEGIGEAGGTSGGGG